MIEEKPTTPAAQWRKRAKSFPIPADHAARQGRIARLALEVLGKDEAIAFLNGESVRLGGRPIALATESVAGQNSVEAELERLRGR